MTNKQLHAIIGASLGLLAMPAIKWVLMFVVWCAT